MMLDGIARGWGSTPAEAQNFLGLLMVAYSTHCYIGGNGPLLHLVANVMSKLKIHQDMLSPWRGECDSYQVSR